MFRRNASGVLTVSVTYNLGNYFAIIFFLLYGREDSGKILASVLQEEENFDVLKRCYIQMYQTSFCCVMEKLLIFNIVKLRVDHCGALVKEAAEHYLVSDIKRDITLKSTLSYFTQTGGTHDENT